jgi:hypothetical protein
VCRADLKITFSDNTSYTITNGTNSKDGAAGTVITISEDGYWELNGVKTNVLAQGSKGETGAQGPAGPQGPAGANGKDGEKGDPGANGKDAHEIKIDGGYWYIDGENTGVRATPDEANSLVAVVNYDTNYYEFYYLVDGQPSADKVKIPIVAKRVTSIVFVPEYTEYGVPVIYAPSITKSGKSYGAPVTLTYRVNPAGAIAGEAFTVVGFVKSEATILKADDDAITVEVGKQVSNE